MYQRKTEEHIMKKMVLAFVLLLSVFVCVFAQEEKKMAAGLGTEWNGNSRDLIAVGLAFNFDYNLPISAAPLAMGFMVTGSDNFTGTRAVEFAAFFRWYFEEKAHNGLFLQAEAGASLIFDNSGNNIPLPVLAGLRIGYRKLQDQSYYIEPYASIGYSFFLRGGVIGGIRF